MSIKKLVSIKNSLQYVSDMMDQDDIRLRPLMTVFAIEGDQKIGSYYSYKKNIVVLDITNCRAELPCGAVAVLGLLMGDHGCDCGTVFNNALTYFPSVFVNSIFLVDGFGACSCSGARFEIQGNCIVFEGNFDKQKVTIQYLGYQLDKEGMPMIVENHVDAIAQYIEYKMALRSRYKPVQFRMSEQQIGDMRREWGRKLKDARAQDGAPDLSEQSDLTNMMNDPISGIGIAMPVYNFPYWYV